MQDKSPPELKVSLNMPLKQETTWHPAFKTVSSDITWLIDIVSFIQHPSASETDLSVLIVSDFGRQFYRAMAKRGFYPGCPTEV
jgi:hypothetical protein